MTVTGYLALYTTLLGWQQYESLWQIAVQTGLIYLPFISLLLSSTLVPFTSAPVGEAGLVALKRVLLQLLTAFLVMAFAATPMMPLDPKVLHVETLCQSDEANTPGHTKTTYDKSFPVPTGVKIPLFWYGVMAVSNGITHAANSVLPCSAIDYRALHTQLETTPIQEPKLKQAVSQFYTDCYLPAYSQYLHQDVGKDNKSEVDWLGSKHFLEQPGFYDSFQAHQSVPGFRFNKTRDIESAQLSHPPIDGNPTCKEWWEDPKQGLHTQLKKALPATFWQKLTTAGGDQQVLEDATIKTLLTQEAKSASLSEKLRGYESLNDNVSGHYLSRFVGAPLGVAYETLSFYPKLHLLMNALPVIQGSLLFAMYAFLALGLVFSSYRISFCVTGAVMIFSVIFCSFIWQVVQWFDTILIQALYPSLGNVPGMGLLNAVQLPNQLFVDMIIGTLYVVLPLLWLSIMGWAGFHAGHQIGALMGAMGHPANRSGEQAGQSVRRFLP
jgi:hypothetical protein